MGGGEEGTATPFYGATQAAIHHGEFGDLARSAAELVLARLAASGLRQGTVVDLGCGSGILAGHLVAAGYRVEGVDLSPDMLALARRHAPGATFRQGSLHDVALPPAVAVTAVGEALNYATDPRAGPAALEVLAARVAEALAPGGVFVMDVATPGRGSRTRFHDRPGWSLAMVATESEDGTRLDRRIAIFHADDADPSRYRRVDEHHVLHLYRPQDMVRVLSGAGLEVEQLDHYGDPEGRSVPALGWAVFVGRRPR